MVQLDGENASIQYVNFDHHDVGKLGDDPFSVYRELRNRCPIGWSEKYGGFWVVTGYDPVYRLAEAWRTCSSAQGMTLPDINPFLRFIPIDYDPPAQQKYRHLLLPYFSPRALAEFAEPIRRYTRALVTSVGQSRKAELVAEIASKVPMFAICLILGVPLADQDRFKSWAHQMAHPGDNQEEGVAAAGELMAYMLGMIDSRRGNSASDLISELTRAKLDGRTLTDDEILSMVFLLLPAGFDTTESALGAIFYLLANDAGLQERLASAELSSAVEELLRYVSPVQCTSRVFTGDAELGGEKATAGQRALLVFGAANRDEAEFSEPDAIVLDRHPNRHLAFGVGVHRCVGAHLARLELRIVLEEVLSGLPRFRLDCAEGVAWHTGHIRGAVRVPVLFEV
ncbi:MAG: cytochrome P450 [Actinomycetota bacterium]